LRSTGDASGSQARACPRRRQIKIGFLLKTMQEERYQRDKAAFVAKAKALGAACSTTG
jgi:D-xylose transport system substrate-binding protein